MDKLEQTKNELASEDAITDEITAQAYCEQFAMETFRRADNAVRANKATMYAGDGISRR
jgi:vacuolar protein sorting-associated protein VTA1